MKKSWLIVVAILALVLSSSSAFGLQMILNGGFETGSFLRTSGAFNPDPLFGWSIGGDFPYLGAFPVPNYWPQTNPEIGNWAASVAPPFLGVRQAIGTSSLYQDFIINPGFTSTSMDFQYMPWSHRSVELSFFKVNMLYDYNGSPVLDEYIYWGDVDFPGLEDPRWLSFHRSYDLSGISGPIACRLEFGVRTTGANSHPGGIFVDNVSVESTPEPATLLLLGSGLLGMGAIGAIRRRRK
jgi:hypothetical protein